MQRFKRYVKSGSLFRLRKAIDEDRLNNEKAEFIIINADVCTIAYIINNCIMIGNIFWDKFYTKLIDDHIFARSILKKIPYDMVTVRLIKYGKLALIKYCKLDICAQAYQSYLDLAIYYEQFRIARYFIKKSI
mgnify:CR=1 FL=1